MQRDFFWEIFVSEMLTAVGASRNPTPAEEQPVKL
jgi:hypothetical protein